MSAPKRKARAYRVAAKEEQRTQQVVYLGYLQLRVRQRIKTLDAVTKLVEEANGYIERVGQRTVVVRIPASDFDATMRRFEALGRVTARRIQALDVSAQFTDLDARLAVAGESQRRLLALLAQEQDVNERLRIVKEIKRLSEQIESIESTLGTLRNLVAYYTITLDIIGTAQHRRSADHRSPFPWVRSLVDHRIVHEAGKDTLSLSVAKGFVRFETADSWHARAADTAIVRAAVLPNEPDGSTTFWHAAVAHELSGRSDVAHEQGQSGGVIWTAWRNRDVEPRIWLIGLKVVRGQIALVEAFFPTVASWKRHRAAVIGTLSSLEVR
ncbi:MAG: DUF4349 domain-containing protein [Myxococcales bacterium]|nr:DUF4349 domain-containing protein [Myxococcales bacterium]